jgi:hypothetical protein
MVVMVSGHAALVTKGMTPGAYITSDDLDNRAAVMT